MKKLLLIGTAVLLMTTSAHAATVYDRNNNVVPLRPGLASVVRGNVRYWYHNGVYAGHAITHGNVTKVYRANGTKESTIRNYGGGRTQSWDARGRPMFHTYGRY